MLIFIRTSKSSRRLWRCAIPSLFKITNGKSQCSYAYNGPAATLGSFNYAGDTTEINGTTADFLSDNTFRVTYPNAAFRDVTLAGSGYTGTTAFSGSFFTNGGTGLSVNPGDLFSFTFRNSFDDTPSGSADNNLNITFDFSDVVLPPPPSTSATLGGSVSSSLAAGELKVYQFQVATAGSYTFDTVGSMLVTSTGTASNDTELGLYDANGAVVAQNDDFAGLGNLSRITTTLTPGTYYLAAGAFDSTFNANFGFSSASTRTGTLVVNGLSVPEPTGLAPLALAGLGALRRRRA